MPNSTGVVMSSFDPLLDNRVAEGRNGLEESENEERRRSEFRRSGRNNGEENMPPPPPPIWNSSSPLLSEDDEGEENICNKPLDDLARPRHEDSFFFIWMGLETGENVGCCVRSQSISSSLMACICGLWISAEIL